MLIHHQTKHPAPKHDGKFYALLAILALICAALLCSCGTLDKMKHKNKEKTDTKTETETITTSTVTEQIDTTITIKPDSAIVIADIVPILRGDTFYIDTEIGTVKTHLDTKNKKLITEIKTKPKQVTVHFNRTKYEKAFSKHREHIKTLSKEMIKEKHRDTGMNLFWYGLLTGIILILLLRALYKWLKTTPYFMWLP